MIQCHTGGFRPAEFGEDGADCDILDDGGRDMRILGERCMKDLAICESEAQKEKNGGTNGSEHLLRVGIAKAAFVGSGYGCTEGGQEDDVI